MVYYYWVLLDNFFTGFKLVIGIKIKYSIFIFLFGEMELAPYKQGDSERPKSRYY